jgi:hypothetical protein
MLPIVIPPSYRGVNIRAVSFPRDINDLIEIHIKNDYGPSSSLQPGTKAIERFYRMFLDWSPYGAYLLSYYGKTVLLLELIPIDSSDAGNFYRSEPYDHFIGIKPAIEEDELVEVLPALFAGVEGIFEANPGIHRLIFSLRYSQPGNSLRILLEQAGFFILKDQLDQESPVIYARERRYL